MFEIKNYANPFHLGIFLDYILRHKIVTGELPFDYKLPGIKNLAQNFHFSERIAIEAYNRLSNAGYIKTVKKGGTKVCFSSDIKSREVYSKNFVLFQNIISTLYSYGFNKDDIFSCFFNALESSFFTASDFLYIEDNVLDLLQGKEELEQLLGIKVNCSLIELLKKESDYRNILVITSFKNYYKLQAINAKLNIIPLRTTPNLSELINFNKIPTYARILYVTSSLEDKRLITEKFGYLAKTFKNFKIIKADEFSKNSKPDILITTKRVLNLLNIDSNIQLYILKKFYDEDGINLIKSKIKEK
jgi:DNA-binding transcriptional regulator YhcF (GntR family)